MMAFLPARGVMCIAVTDAEQVAGVGALGRESRTERSAPTIGRAQGEYMVSRFPSRDATTQHIGKGYRYYLIQKGRESLGYLAVEPRAVMQDMGGGLVRDDYRRGKTLSLFGMNFC